MSAKRVYLAARGLIWPNAGADKSAEPDEPETALPRRQLSSVLLTQFFQGVQITLPFTLSAYMVRHFEGPDASEQLIGQLTGLMAAAAPFSRFLSSFPLGVVSDYVGRKSIILVSNITSSLGVVAYGASTNYLQAMLARLLPGLLNGSAVAMKSMLGESCDTTNQARAMAIFTLGWGMGSVVGPLLGGVLGEPCNQFDGFPLCQPGQLFDARPYLLPCLVTGGLGIVAFCSNLVLMDETLPRLQGKGSLYTKLRPARSSSDASSLQLTASSSMDDSSKHRHAPAETTAEETVAGAALVALSWNFLDELTPIFVSAPTKQRGLGLPLEAFTYPVIFGGVILVIYSLLLFPVYQKAVGPLHAVKVGLIGGLPCSVLVPAASLVGGKRIPEEAMLFLAMGIKGVFKIMSMTSSMVLINMAAPKSSIGAVNGAAMAFTSLARALGPALCGTAWALAVSLEIPGQQFLGFLLMAVAAVCTAFLYRGMKLPGRS
ncbi:hypothetical protein WJX73_005735 [Symbiochloris irregularis]|uniref:Major facilitator superfamily (MFS) profile domain-containing protein n=1 Tax=Symbiochloris irregularis TaxID=706552 RepID=A0AAW1NYM8_9CHLO